MRGKRGRPVPILFTEVEKDAITTLINLSEKVGVRKANVFVFSVPTRASLEHIRGNDAMRKVFHEIDGLNEVQRIRSTELRKYCGTVSQIADLYETNLRRLANHMGHNLHVHREFYRLHDSTIKLTKAAQLLCAIDEGNASSFTGKKPSEITIEG